MEVENIKPTISDEDAYKRGFYYVLMTQTEPDGPFSPVTNFYIGDSVIKFATPEDAEDLASVKRYGITTYGYRIAKVVVEEVKTVTNKEAIEITRAMREWCEYACARDPKLWANREGLRLIGELIPYLGHVCWHGYKAGERKEDGRSEQENNHQGDTVAPSSEERAGQV